MFCLLFTFILCNFSVRILKYFQKRIKLFFVHKNFKKRASKVAHNQPKPFYFTVQSSPDHSPLPRIDFSYILWNLGTRHLFSYLWIGSNDALYASYFWWRDYYEVRNSQQDRGQAFCDLCFYLNSVEKPVKTYQNMHKWWVEDADCKSFYSLLNKWIAKKPVNISKKLILAWT